MSNLSELLPSGGAQNVVEFVASGAIGNGKTVILNSNGTVTVVASTTVSESIPAGSLTNANAASSSAIVSAFDPNVANKFVIAYNTSSIGKARVGTVSGTSLSFGAEATFNSGVTGAYNSIQFDPNTAGKFIISFTDNGNGEKGAATVGTVSGTSLSFGSEYIFNSAYTYWSSLAFDPNTSGLFVLAYEDAGSANKGTAISGTLSGTALSFGTEAVFETSATKITTVAFDPNVANKFVIAYRKQTNEQGLAIVGTVSGSSVSYGSTYTFNAAATGDHISLSMDPINANKFIIAYKDAGNSGSGTCIIGTMSGTNTLSFGSEFVFNSGNTPAINVAFSLQVANKFAVGYRNQGSSSVGTVVIGLVSGSGITYGTPSVVQSAVTSDISVIFSNTLGKFIFNCKDDGSSGHAFSAVCQMGAVTTNLTATNFVGMPDKAYVNGATAVVALEGGVSTNQTSLTIGSTYFVQGDGTLGTSAGTVSVEAGKAISATSLLLKGI